MFSGRTNKSKPVPQDDQTRPTRVKNQFVINNPVGVLNLGATYNINVEQAITEVNTNNVTRTKNYKYKPTGNKERLPAKKEEMLNKNIPTKECMQMLCSSRRQVEYADILKLSQNIGSNWKAVGLIFQDGLMFNAAQMEGFEADTKCLSDGVRRMLYRWLQWKDTKATVGKLALALFQTKEFDALRCLTP